MTTLTQVISSEEVKDVRAIASVVNHPSKQITGVSKDGFSSKDKLTKASEGYDLSFDNQEQVALVPPKASFASVWTFTEADNFSIISQILMMVTALANADSQAYRTQAQMANENSNYAARLAPIIKQMVLTNWENQASSTRCDAEKAKTAGIGGIVAGVAGIGLGAWTHYGEVTKDAAKITATDGTKAVGALEDTASTNAAKALKPTQSMEHGIELQSMASKNQPTSAPAKTVANNAVTENEKAAAQRTPGAPGTPESPPAGTPAPASAGKGLKDTVSNGIKKIGRWAKAGQIIGKVMMAIQSVHVVTEGGTKLAGDMKYDFQKAEYQKEIGQADAAEKQISALQGVATSAGQRMNEAAGQSQKGHGEGLSSLQRMSADVSQSIINLYRA